MLIWMSKNVWQGGKSCITLTPVQRDGIPKILLLSCSVNWSEILLLSQRTRAGQDPFTVREGWCCLYSLCVWLLIPYQPFSQSSALEQVAGRLVEVFTKTLPPTCFTGKGDTYSSLVNQAVSLIQGPEMDGAENRSLCLKSEDTQVDTGEITLRCL